MSRGTQEPVQRASTISSTGLPPSPVRHSHRFDYRPALTRPGRQTRDDVPRWWFDVGYGVVIAAWLALLLFYGWCYNRAAAGSGTGQFMVRKGCWKYVTYVGERPQLFDLERDPEEVDDLWDHPEHQSVLRELDAELRSICDPLEVNARAFSDQQARIDAFGGLSGIEESLDIPFTPAPQ